MAIVGLPAEALHNLVALGYPLVPLLASKVPRVVSRSTYAGDDR